MTDDSNAKKKPTEDYSIGFGKPPASGQFKPGKSGNPSGRPRGRKGLNGHLDALMKKKHLVNMPEGQIKMSAEEIMAMAIIQAGRKGNIAILKLLMDRAAQNPHGMEVTIAELKKKITELEHALVESRKKEHTGAVIAIPQRSITWEEWLKEVKEYEAKMAQSESHEDYIARMLRGEYDAPKKV